MFWPGLGDGWEPAFISSLTELKFIRTNAPTLSSHSTFFLGGSTNTRRGQNLAYFEYQRLSTGTLVETLEIINTITFAMICKVEVVKNEKKILLSFLLDSFKGGLV